jgi:hypothetical protein
MDSYIPIRHWVALALLLAVLVIFVSPIVNVPETALRANGLALRLALMLLAFGTLLTGLLNSRIVVLGFLSREDNARGSIPLLRPTLPLLC